MTFRVVARGLPKSHATPPKVAGARQGRSSEVARDFWMLRATAKSRARPSKRARSRPKSQVFMARGRPSEACAPLWSVVRGRPESRARLKLYCSVGHARRPKFARQSQKSLAGPLHV